MDEFLLQVESIVHFPDQGTILHGVVQGGEVFVGDKVEVASPLNAVETQIEGIEDVGTGKFKNQTGIGEQVAVLVKNLDLSILEDGLEFDDLTVIPKDIVLRMSAPEPRWWEFWK